MNLVCHTVTLIFIVTYLTVSRCFPPTSIPGDRDSVPLRIITITGIYRAVGKFIKMYDLIPSANLTDGQAFDKYIDSDADASQRLAQTVDEITTYLMSVKTDRKNLAHYHVQGEQIFLAHTYVKQIRQKIDDAAKSKDPDIQFLRKLIGEALYTIQEFYSNTNWVELFGATAYLDFGVEGITLMEIARTDQPMCDNCDFLGFDDPPCNNNLLQQGTPTLTSGYHSGQDILKPKLDRDKGKCSHGGPDDDSKSEPATGGINKERSNKDFSPHHYLHRDAANAAILATEAFVIDKDTGIHKMLGKDLFKKVFNLQSRAAVSKSSLSFVMDVSGSMSDDIAAAVEQTVELVTSSIGTNNEPENYVLATFNDPESLTTGKVTTDGNEMIKWLKALKADGGKDCPEYIMSGIARAVQLSLPDSKVYVFTDADAKDPDRETDVLNAARAKNISFDIFTTGSCGRRKRSTRLQKRSTDLYTRIAVATGGQMIRTTKAELSDVMKKVIIEENLPSSSVIIDKRDGYTDTSLTFPVDDMIDLLKIEVFGASSVDNIELKSESGQELGSGIGAKAVVRFYTKGKSIITVQHPDSGMITLGQKVKGTWDITIAAQSRLDIDVQILEEKELGYHYPISENPITGHQYFVVADVYNLPENASISSITLVYSDGEIMDLDNITKLGEESRYLVPCTFEKKVTAFQVNGFDDDDNLFKRTSLRTISPVNAKLHVEIVDDLTIGEKQNVTYTIENLGQERKTFVVLIGDDKGFISSSRTVQHTVESTSISVNSFLIEPSSGPTILTFSVSLVLQGSTEILQVKQQKCLVSAVRNVACVIRNVTNMCPPESQTAEMCSKHLWMGLADIEYSGTTIDTIYLTNAPESTLLEYNNATGTSGVISANVSGTCCGTSVYLNVVDEAGYFSRCHFLVSENITEQTFFFAVENFISTTPPPPPPQQEEQFPSFIIGIVVGLVIVAGVIAIAATISAKRQKMKRKRPLQPEEKALALSGTK